VEKERKDEVFQGNLIEYEFDGCSLLPAKQKCERLICDSENGELLIAHFESCCPSIAVDAEPALKCEIEHEESVEISVRTWGLAIGAVMLISLASLDGITVIAATGGKINRMLLHDASALAIGVLLSAVFVHILLKTAEHGTFGWEKGTSFLGGIMAALIIKMVATSMGHSYDHSNLESLGNAVLKDEEMKQMQS